MLYIHDKAKAVFGVTSNGQHKIKKAKVISIATEETSESAKQYFLDMTNKMPTHFILDGSDIVKYDYNTTNVFPIDTKWEEKSKRIIEQVKLDMPEQISGTIKATSKPLTSQSFDEPQLPEEIIIYYSNNTADDFYTYLDMRQEASAYHYILDDQTCYCIVPPTVACYTKNKIHIVALCKNNTFDVFDRVAKLIDQLMKDYAITQYMPIDETDHIHAIKPEDFKSIQERINVINNTGGTTEESAISTRKDDANAGDHIISVKLLYNSFDTLTLNKINNNDLLTDEEKAQQIKKIQESHSSSFARKEQALIKFIAEYLFYFDLDTSSVWRITEFANGTTGANYYNYTYDFHKLLEAIEDVLGQLKQGVTQIEVSNTGLPEYDESGAPIKKIFTPDTRSLSHTTYFMTNDQKSINQDYDSITIGNNVELRSKFEDGAGAFSETVQFSSCYYEPVYPDLTVPPRNSTVLYNKGLMSPKDILKEMDQPYKPVIGKMPNAFDPYPTDDKIAQLEMHSPIVTLEYENAGDVNANMLGFVNNRFGNTEKRLVRLENILSTIMRYQARLASRISINCQYYGGQSVFGKYDAIRCMCDDLTNDADTRTLDQCLNCSRYEPILGQFYEINGDNPGMAQIYDDVQASLMTKDEFVKFNNLTDYFEAIEKTEEDLTALHIKNQNDKDYDELLDEADNFVMNWAETPYHTQSPHINTYEYDPIKIYTEKMRRLNKDNIYEDGWKDQEQLKFKRPQYGLNTISGGNFNPMSSEVDGLNGLYGLSDFDIQDDDVRLRIINTCESVMALAKEAKVLYTYGALIKSEFMKDTPSRLYERVLNNEIVNEYTEDSTTNKDDKNYKAVYFDCSAFASYVYIHCGIIKSRFTSGTLKDYYGFKFIASNGKPLLDQLKNVYPGDLILYKKHVSIYAGEDYEYEASSDNPAYTTPTTQVLKSKVKNTDSFVGICRHTSLSNPSVKNKATIKVSATLDNYVEMQVGINIGRDTNGDGYINSVAKNNWLKDKNVLRNYIDVKSRLNPELKMQFADIRDLKTPGIITEDTINDYLLRVGGAAMKKVRGYKVSQEKKVVEGKVYIDYVPARDSEGKLIPEERFAFPRGDVWMEAANRSGLNPLFLMAHCAKETNYCCNSNWTNYSGEFMSKSTDDYLFNAFNIWCYDEEDLPDHPSMHRATAKRETEARKWFTLERSIVEGALWLKESYLGEESVSSFGRRDTPYFMKWHFGNLIAGQNPNCKPATKQYSTDVTWADTRAKVIYDALKGSPVGREQAIKHFEYHIPEFADSQPQIVGMDYKGERVDLGLFEVTHYCAGNCDSATPCNGDFGNLTAHGHTIHVGTTIAVDRSVIPFGSWVYMEGYGYRKACDVGSAIKGHKIDVAVQNDEIARAMGRKEGVRVYLLKDYKGDC